MLAHFFLVKQPLMAISQKMKMMMQAIIKISCASVKRVNDMTECMEQRRRLSSEFQQYRKVFIALGDETRQSIKYASRRYNELLLCRCR